MKVNKSSQVKPENLIPIASMDRLFELADQRKSVWWVSRKKLWAAAFFQNWSARQVDRAIKEKWIMEVK